jgi:hypothetical protein
MTVRYTSANSASHFCVDLRVPRLRLSRPANQRFVSLAPNRRRSLSRRSAFLRNLHEQFFGIVQAAKGRRGASCSRKILPVARIAAVQHKMLGAIETARKSPPVVGRPGFGIDAGFLAGRSLAILPNSSFSILIMTIPVIDQRPCVGVEARHLPSLLFLPVSRQSCAHRQEQCHRQRGIDDP